MACGERPEAPAAPQDGQAGDHPELEVGLAGGRIRDEADERIVARRQVEVNRRARARRDRGDSAVASASFLWVHSVGLISARVARPVGIGSREGLAVPCRPSTAVAVATSGVEMDLGPAALAIVAFVLGGVFNAVVGGAAGEFQARQAEQRRVRREQAQRLREHWLAETERTHNIMSADVLRLAAQARGDARLEASLPSDPAGRGAAYDLIGDVSVARAFFDLEARLFYRKPGAGLSEEDLRSWVSTMGRVGDAFDAQARRIMNDEEPIRIPRDVLETMSTWRTTFPRPPSATNAVGDV